MRGGTANVRQISAASASGRPRTAKGKATRARIVGAASRLIFRQGVAHTTLDHVCETAEVSRSQLYHYFGDKAALVRAVVEQQTENVLAAQEPYLSRLDSWDGWQAWRDRIVALQRPRACVGGCPLGSLASALSDADEAARLAVAAGFERWASAFRRGLESMQQAGRLRPGADPKALSLVVLTAFQGGLLVGQAQRNVRPLEAALDAALAYLRGWSADDG
jgi:TetR/AcrR family transcriptional regulator, transcriptional repressor for nem operon